MDIQEIRRLLEKARFELPVISTNIPTRKLIGESLDLLEQQPTASEFTKEIQKKYGISLTIARDNPEKKQWEAERDLIEACDIIDTAEARLKVLPDLLEACEGMVKDLEMIEQDEAITACQCMAKAPDDIIDPLPCYYCAAKTAIAKATKEG